MAPEPAWDTVSRGAPSRIDFDTDGDEFTGIFCGFVKVDDPRTGDQYDYLEFTGDDGEPYQVSASYQLARAFAVVPEGSYCKITRKRLIDMGPGKNPMKDFLVQTRRP